MATGSVWTNNGRNEIHDVITGGSSKTIVKFIIGTGTTTPVITDTALTSKIGGFAAKAFDSGYPTFDTGNVKATVRGTISTGEGNGNTIAEAALVDTGDTLIFTHDVFTGITKNASTEIILEWTYKISNG